MRNADLIAYIINISNKKLPGTFTFFRQLVPGSVSRKIYMESGGEVSLYFYPYVSDIRIYAYVCAMLNANDAVDKVNAGSSLLFRASTFFKNVPQF